jgi:hypothetical protein
MHVREMRAPDTFVCQFGPVGQAATLWSRHQVAQRVGWVQPLLNFGATPPGCRPGAGGHEEGKTSARVAKRNGTRRRPGEGTRDCTFGNATAGSN